MLSRVAPIDPRHVLTRCGSFKQGAVRALGRELRRQSVEHGTRPLFLVRVRSKFADVDVVLLDLELQMWSSCRASKSRELLSLMVGIQLKPVKRSYVPEVLTLIPLCLARSRIPRPTGPGDPPRKGSART